MLQRIEPKPQPWKQHNVCFGSKADVNEPVEIVRLVPQADIPIRRSANAAISSIGC